MRIKLPKKPTFEIRCPDNVGIITLLLQGIAPLQKWFPQSTLRIVSEKRHHHWLKTITPDVILSTETHTADYVISDNGTVPWYQHRWVGLLKQFVPLGLRNPSEFMFPKMSPPDSLNLKTPCITKDPDYAQWMALWDIPVIWQCDPNDHNPLHYAPLGVRHILIHPHQTDLLASPETLITDTTNDNESPLRWSQCAYLSVF